MAVEVIKPNMTLIAEKCGVSKMTVSRVFRNAPNVSQATRDFVLRAAEDIGFVPSGAHGRNSAFAAHYYVLFQKEWSTEDAYFSDIIRSVQEELFERGFGCSFGIINGRYSDFIKLTNILRSRDTRGVFVVGEVPTSYADALQANFLNVIFIDYPGDPRLARPHNAVSIDNLYGGHLAMRHLLALGRKRILLISGREGHYFWDDLLAAYKTAIAEGGLEFDPDLVARGDFHVRGGYSAAKSTIEKGIRFDAIFSNDETACGAMMSLKEKGLRIPADIAIVGFDGLPMGEMADPPLTTVAVDRERLGRIAVRQLLGLANETDVDAHAEKIVLFPRLLIRQSCGATRSTTVSE